MNFVVAAGRYSLGDCRKICKSLPAKGYRGSDYVRQKGELAEIWEDLMDDVWGYQRLLHDQSWECMDEQDNGLDVIVLMVIPLSVAGELLAVKSIRRAVIFLLFVAKVLLGEVAESEQLLEGPVPCHAHTIASFPRPQSGFAIHAGLVKTHVHFQRPTVASRDLGPDVLLVSQCRYDLANIQSVLGLLGAAYGVVEPRKVLDEVQQRLPDLDGSWEVEITRGQRGYNCLDLLDSWCAVVFSFEIDRYEEILI